MEQARVLPRIGKARATLLLIAAVLVGSIGARFVAERAGRQSHDARPHQGRQIVLTSREPAGSWTAAAPLPVGRVLVVGGIVHGAISRSVLIYDPRTRAWRAGPPTLSPHAQQNALTLPDGRVLIAGGYGGRAEVYDPRAGRWTGVGGPDVLAHPILALLRNGDALLATGVNNAGQPFSSTSLFDPKTNRWSSAAT